VFKAAVAPVAAAAPLVIEAVDALTTRAPITAPLGSISTKSLATSAIEVYSLIASILLAQTATKRHPFL